MLIKRQPFYIGVEENYLLVYAELAREDPPPETVLALQDRPGAAFPDFLRSQVEVADAGVRTIGEVPASLIEFASRRGRGIASSGGADRIGEAHCSRCLQAQRTQDATCGCSRNAGRGASHDDLRPAPCTSYGPTTTAST